MTPRLLAAFSIAAALTLGCAPPPFEVVQAPPEVRPELWEEPSSPRELFYGVGGREHAPPERPRFTLLKRDPSGFGVTLDLEDADGDEWSAKLGEEAQSEVTSSRIVWGLGYHQNDIGEFERRGFIDRVEGGRVTFHFDGRHQALLRQITPKDVVWTCTRLASLTDAQWDDAFRAGGYPEDVRRRYVAKIKSKIQEGLALGASQARR